MLMEAIDKAGHSGVCTVGLDVASSEFKVEGENAYDLDFNLWRGQGHFIKLSGDDARLLPEDQQRLPHRDHRGPLRSR